MKNQLRVWITPIAFLSAYLLMMSCNSGGEEKKADQQSAPEVQPATSHIVEIKEMKFIPAEIKVKKGDEIVFVNHDLVAHDITEKAAKKWNSSPIKNGDSWKYVAEETVDYFCSIHPVMNGKIVVE